MMSWGKTLTFISLAPRNHRLEHLTNLRSDPTEAFSNSL